MKKLILATSLILFTYNINAQDSLKVKPKKYGLALSGGGAKGFAHIGILKAIDSLGIKIDYITGTSMGGILGGMYAMGYTGKEIDSIVKHTKWKKVLSNKISYDKVKIYEKDEYDKYIISFPVEKAKVTLPNSLIEGQYMSEVLNSVTFNAKHINNFYELPIPVQLTASNIIDGGLEMQNKGSLPLAIRSTLAIPAAFAPVYINGKLYVDGGLDRNFPVKEVKEMGSDVIIGGYTGFRLFTKKEIENPMKMIYQTHAFNSVKDFEKQKTHTDVLIDFVAALKENTTKDFNNYKEIIRIGEEETKKHLPELIAIKEEQKQQGIKYNHTLIKEKKLPTIDIQVFEDNGKEITGKEKENILLLLNLKVGKYHDLKSVNKAIENIYGTLAYDKVYYTYTNTVNGLVMNIFIKKAKQGDLKLAMHYDNEQSIGIILNYTHRNLKPKKSRIVVTTDISENFKSRVRYYKFLDLKNRLWLSNNITYTNTINNDLALRINDNNQELKNLGFKIAEINNQLNLNYATSFNSKISLGLEYNYDLIYRALDKKTELLLENDFKRKIYKHQNFNVNFNYTKNTLNSKYYYTSGHFLQAGFKAYFSNMYKIYANETDNTVSLVLNPNEGYYIPKRLVSFYLTDTYSKKLSNKLALKLNTFVSQHVNFKKQPTVLTEKFDDSTEYQYELYPYLFINQKYFMGGSEFDSNIRYTNFEGLRHKELGILSLAKSQVSLQYNPTKNLFVTPSFTYSFISDQLNIIDNIKNEDISFDNNTFFGYGLNIGYNSIIGPVNFNISQNNIFEVWRVYFNIGYKF